MALLARALTQCSVFRISGGLEFSLSLFDPGLWSTEFSQFSSGREDVNYAVMFKNCIKVNFTSSMKSNLFDQRQ